MQGPYRTRLHPPESHEGYWRVVERSQRLRRRAPALLAVLGFVPALAVFVSTAIAKTGAPPRGEMQRVLASPDGTEWGLVVSSDTARPWRGALPAGVARPDLEAATASVAEVQSLLETQAAPKVLSCFRERATFFPELSGDVVVSVVVDTRGRAHSTVTGSSEVRRRMRGCIQAALESVTYPVPRHEKHWFHFPIRFDGGPRAP